MEKLSCIHLYIQVHHPVIQEANIVTMAARTQLETRGEMLTFGYIRNIEKNMNKDTIIPKGIMQICFQYFFVVKYRAKPYPHNLQQA